MNRVFKDGKELFGVTVTLTGDTFTLEENHHGASDSKVPPNPQPTGGGGPGEEHGHK